MESIHIKTIAKKLAISENQIKSTLELLNEGATIPFISRYRKERTGSLNEVQIQNTQKEYEHLLEIDKRRNSILSTIDKQDKLTDELKNKLLKATDLTELEDIYLPYKQKKRTRATKAREKGLEPLAQLLMLQHERDVESKALRFVNDQVESAGDALLGARDIMAEWVSENQTARNSMRQLFAREAMIYSKVVKGKEEEAAKYTDYFDFSEALKKCPSHRLMAIKRGEKEGLLRFHIEPAKESAIEKLNRFFIKSNNEAAKQVELAVEDSYKRLLKPSIETEYGNLSKEKADDDAIGVFTKNLQQLLLAAPLGEKRVLALDPGFRTGCKLVCIDEKGDLIHNETIYPHPPQKEINQAARKIAALVSAYKIEAIAIGNGTASRETEHFVKNKVTFDRKVQVFVVNESGASIYSASKIAREEFPNYDVTVRGAVSIGRRLMDPLAELVKIDAKSIGVGQYQHDVDQTKLQKSLDVVVESCVNSVGVDLNTASKHLLTYVSGLGSQLAQNIIDYRKENGTFQSRKELKKVARLGAKAYEQAAGFLRIRNAKNLLDNSAVHPESYHVVEKMAKDLKVSISDLLSSNELRKKLNLNAYVDEKIGLPTLKDIVKELSKHGRDPREKIKFFEFSQQVRSIADLYEGQVLPGIVNNITNFGAFVDIGIKESGLVHISQIKDAYVSNPADVLILNQHVNVKIISVDTARKRIQLSMKGIEQ